MPYTQVLEIPKIQDRGHRRSHPLLPYRQYSRASLILSFFLHRLPGLKSTIVPINPAIRREVSLRDYLRTGKSHINLTMS